MNEIESQLAAVLDTSSIVTDGGARGRYEIDWLRTTSGVADAIVRPIDTASVARCVSWCADQGIGVVPQGGHTGLVGGAVPIPGRRQIIISLERLNRLREIDPVSNTITVEAGMVLQQVQEVAAAHDRLFPLSLGAQGSCQIGGCIATNAGGTAVLRYGNARELVLGLEAVLPDGSAWSRLKTLRKDNAGFDLKHLFIGTEGTLGIVTAASLRMFPKPLQTVVALAAVTTIQAVLDLFVRVRNTFDAELTAFEFMSGEGLSLVCHHLGRSPPLNGLIAYAVLIELSSPHPGDGLMQALLPCLGDAGEAGVVSDAAMAANLQQAEFFWTLRESLPEAMLRKYPQCSPHDISVPIARIPEFMASAQAETAQRWPELSSLIFGHVGDGNLHFNFIAPEPLETRQFECLAAQATQALYELTDTFGGSISAEHGVGVHKFAMHNQFAPAAQLHLMRTLKHAVDGRGLMNPGKIFQAT